MARRKIGVQDLDLNSLIEEVIFLRGVVKKQAEELDIERCRLAACSVATYSTKQLVGMKKEYKSASLSDVIRLVKQYDKLYRDYSQLEEAHNKVCTKNRKLERGSK